MKRKLFCELHPACYWISRKKEILKRKARDFLKNDLIAKEKSNQCLPYVLFHHESVLIRELPDVDLTLQNNKVTNITLALKHINGMIIHPGETFSFWRSVGETTKKKGYKEGLQLYSRNLSKGVGGGLCQLTNMIHQLVLHSPMEVVELHHHTDALFPDVNRRVPFGTGTSINYNNKDYRFKNTTNQDMQLSFKIADGKLIGELRSNQLLDVSYKLLEENHFFQKEGDRYYRHSEVNRITYNSLGHQINKERILNNHSEVLYDYSLIPEDEIRCP